MSTSKVVRDLIQHKSEIAAGLSASGATITWLEQANAYVDLIAGSIAIVAGILTIVWYIKKFRQARKSERKE